MRSQGAWTGISIEDGASGKGRANCERPVSIGWLFSTPNPDYVALYLGMKIITTASPSTKQACPALVPPLSRPCPALVPGLFCATAVLRPRLKPIKIGGLRTPPNKHVPPLSRPCPALPALVGHSSDGTPKYVRGLVFNRSQFLATKGGKGGAHFALWVILRLGPQSHEKVKRPYSANNPIPPFPPLSRPCPRLTANAPVSLGHILGAHSSLSISGEGFSCPTDRPKGELHFTPQSMASVPS